MEPLTFCSLPQFEFPIDQQKFKTAAADKPVKVPSIMFNTVVEPDARE